MATMGFMGWKGFLERFLDLRPRDWPYQSKLAFGRGKSQSWTRILRTSFLFFAAWNLLYVDGWETNLHASSHCSVSQRVKYVPFTRSSSPERAQCNSSQRFSTRSEQQLSLGRIAIGSAPQLYFNCVLPVHRDESGTQLIVGEYPILNTRH